jgi:hypothetical protein
MVSVNCDGIVTDEKTKIPRDVDAVVAALRNVTPNADE